MTNVPILYQNILFGLPSRFAEDCFLWAASMRGNDRACYRAEAFAREADVLFRSDGPLQQMIDAAFRVFNTRCASTGGTMRVDDQVKADLLSFIQTRHANYRLGGNMTQPPSRKEQ